MQEIRCKKCGKLLFLISSCENVSVEIKCPRCNSFDRMALEQAITDISKFTDDRELVMLIKPSKLLQFGS